LLRDLLAGGVVHFEIYDDVAGGDACGDVRPERHRLPDSGRARRRRSLAG
jgi:hypothetical protein